MSSDRLTRDLWTKAIGASIARIIAGSMYAIGVWLILWLFGSPW